MGVTYRQRLEKKRGSAYSALKGGAAIGAAFAFGPTVANMAFAAQQATPIYNGAIATGMALAGFLTLGYGFDNAILKPVSACLEAVPAHQKEKAYRNWMRIDGTVRETVLERLDNAQNGGDVDRIAEEYVDTLVNAGMSMGYSKKDMYEILGDNAKGITAKDNPIRGQLRQARKNGSLREQILIGRAENIAMRRLEDFEGCKETKENMRGRPMIITMPNEDWTRLVESRGIVKDVRREDGFLFIALEDLVAKDPMTKKPVVREIRCVSVKDSGIRGADVEYRNCRINASNVIGHGRKLEPAVNAVADRMFMSGTSGVEDAKREYEGYLEDARLSGKNQQPANVKLKPSGSKFLKRTILERARPGGWLDRHRKQIEEPPQFDAKTGRYIYEMPWLKRLLYTELYDFLDLGFVEYINSRDMRSKIAIWLDNRPWYLKPVPLRTAYNTLHLPFRLAALVLEDIGSVVKDRIWTDKLERIKKYTGMKKKADPKGRIGSLIGSTPWYLRYPLKGAYNIITFNNITKLGFAYLGIRYVVDPVIALAGISYYFRDGIYFAGGGISYYLSRPPKLAVPAEESADN